MPLKTLGLRIKALDTRRINPPPKIKAPFYGSPEWKSLIRYLLKLRGRACERCGRKGTRIFGDHVIELRDGGAPLDADNVMLLCGSCHTLKTNTARAARIQGEAI